MKIIKKYIIYNIYFLGLLKQYLYECWNNWSPILYIFAAFTSKFLGVGQHLRQFVTQKS